MICSFTNGCLSTIFFGDDAILEQREWALSGGKKETFCCNPKALLLPSLKLTEEAPQRSTGISELSCLGLSRLKIIHPLIL